MEFVVTETVGEAPAFHAVGTGQPYPHVEGRRLALTIIRSDVDDVVRVIE